MIRYKDYKGIPGIYKWENLINHKCYIGQSIDLNKRISHHFSNIRSGKCDNPLYRAIQKYGIDNFDLTVIETFKSSDNIKSTLDEKEKYYIQKYDSFGNNGYNQTLGGDGGILGYKFTEEQKRHVSINSTKVAENKSKRVYMYNILTKYTYIWIDVKHAANYLNVDNSTVRKACLDKLHLIKNEWILSHSEENVKERLSLTYKYKNKGQFKQQYYGTFIYNESKFIGNVKDASAFFNISKSYLYGICNGSRKSNILLFIPN